MDFNARSIDEQSYIDSPEIAEMLDLFLQELDIIFSTEKSTVFGQRSIGMSMEQMLWSTSFNASYMGSLIKQEIDKTSNASINFQYDVNVSLAKGVSKDIGIIEIHIKDSNNILVAKPQFIFK